jgi:hypothetical protein
LPWPPVAPKKAGKISHIQHIAIGPIPVGTSQCYGIEEKFRYSRRGGGGDLMGEEK